MTRILGRAGLLLIASATMTLACAHAPPVRAADPAEVRASIDGTLRQFGAAMRRADPAAIASMFTEDGEYVVATRKGFVTGRADGVWRIRVDAIVPDPAG